MIRRHPGVGEQRSENTGMAPVTAVSYTNGIEKEESYASYLSVGLFHVVAGLCDGLPMPVVCRAEVDVSGGLHDLLGPCFVADSSAGRALSGWASAFTFSYRSRESSHASVRSAALGRSVLPGEFSCWTAAWGHRPRHTVSQICVTGAISFTGQ